MIDFRSRIAQWRKAAGLTQAQLDEACGFPGGTVQRLEQRRLILKDDQLVLILISTRRNLLWTLCASLGSLYKRLEPLDVQLREERNAPEAPMPPDDDPEYQEDLDRMWSGMQAVAKRLYRAADPRTSIRDFLLRAATDVPPGEPKRRRVRSKKKPKDVKAPGVRQAGG
jgi:transcriptional regulator with XRE-family HTH domain